jgi:hypothetical protein
MKTWKQKKLHAARGGFMMGTVSTIGPNDPLAFNMTKINCSICSTVNIGIRCTECGKLFIEEVAR